MEAACLSLSATYCCSTLTSCGAVSCAALAFTTPSARVVSHAPARSAASTGIAAKPIYFIRNDIARRQYCMKVSRERRGLPAWRAVVDLPVRADERLSGLADASLTFALFKGA